MTTAGPTVVRRQLGRRLRQLRGQAGMSVDQVVAERHLGISRAKLFKLEAGKHSVKPQDIAALCSRYGTSKEETTRLQELALATQDRDAWHAYGRDAIPEWFSLYVDFEPAAIKTRTYESELVPGLLQTRDYAWAIYKAAQPDLPDEDIERHVSVRMNRQTRFDERAGAHKLHAVVAEAVLLRQVGGAEVMAAQLARLREAATRPEITIDVLTFAAGAHAAMSGTFSIIDFPNPEDDPPVVYVDTNSSGSYLQKPEELETYNTLFQRILSIATPLLDYSP